jgi:two-component system nitrogen regulation response regulator GlnG
LFYRLNVVRIDLPPLRRRREDVRLLVNYFLKRFAPERTQPKSVSPDVLGALQQYDWPGNVRELENVIRRALVVAKGDVLLTSDLPADVLANRPALAAGSSPAGTAAISVPLAAGPTDGPSLARALFQWARADGRAKVIPTVERELVIQALIETQGNQVQAAKLLGITRATLRKRIEKFGIKQELAIK